MDKFPIIELKGTHREIGFQHGEALKEKIQATIEFYQSIFNTTQEEIFSQAAHFTEAIREFNPNYLEEIEGIAEGSGIDIRWIVALNARSEILTMFISECTAIVSPAYGLLAQNWDWAEALEELAVIMKITYNDGRKILMMTEPGIIGKIGLNSAGLGTTLNFLHAPGILDGVPIHILLRGLLDCQSLEEGKKLVQSYHQGKGGNIIFASATNYYNFEFANQTCYTIYGEREFSHTNHFLSNDELNTNQDKLASSRQRYQRSQEIIAAQKLDMEAIKSLLEDQKYTDLPICRPYVFDVETGNVGTVCSLIMDLANTSLTYTPGNPRENEYRTITLAE